MKTITPQSKIHKYIESIYQWLDSNYRNHFIKILSYTALLFAWFVFEPTWYELINKVWVIPVMSQLSGWLLITVSITVTLLLSIYYFFTCKKERRISGCRLVLALVIAFIYINCLCSANWEYMYLIKSLRLAYADITFIPLIGEISFLIILCGKRRKMKIDDTGLEFEKVLEDESGDDYQRDNYITSISHLLSRTFSEKMSFAIGVTGMWGSGKSSFINLLKHKIENSVDIIIEFKPWFCKSSADIIDEFFKIYQNSISPYAPDIMRLIRNYAKSLMDIEQSKWMKYTNYLINQNVDRDSKGQYDKIVDELRSLKLKVVIIIDDLDRLSKDEIMEVLHLIRNGANFPYTQFFVAYDRKYITDSLSESNIPRPSEYLAKIFNTEITLPKVEEKVICEQLHKRLIPILAMFHTKPLIIEELAYTKCRTQYLIPRLLHSMRDVIRFSNALQLNLQPFALEIRNRNEINIMHFFYLELIRYSFPEIYETLRDNPEKILTEDLNEKVYRFAPPTDAKEPHIIDNIITIEHQSLRNEIFALLYSLFATDKKPGNNHYIWHMRSYIKYFAYRIDSGVLTMLEMSDALEYPNSLERIKEICQTKLPDELSNKIHQCLLYVSQSITEEKDGQNITKPRLPFNLVYEFIWQAVSKDKDLFDKDIKSAINLHLSAMKVLSFEHLDSLLCLWQDILKHFPDSLDRSTNQAVLMHILFKDNLSNTLHCKISEQIKLHITIVLESVMKHPTILNITNTIIDGSQQEITQNFLLTKSEFDPIIIKNLKAHLADIKKLSNEDMSLFSNCVDFTKKQTSINDAIAVMKQYIKAQPQDYIDIFVQINLISDTYFISPEPHWKILFNKAQQMKEFIFNNKRSQLRGIEKAKNFWELYENNNYENLAISNKETVERLEKNNFQDDAAKSKRLSEIIQDVSILESQIMDLESVNLSSFRKKYAKALTNYDQAKLDYLHISNVINIKITHISSILQQL